MNYQDTNTSSINISNGVMPTCLKFDRLFFRMPLCVLKDWNPRLFLSLTTSSGEPLYHTYDSRRTNLPYLLWIKIDVDKEMLLINISSKCLLDRYLELISKDNIVNLLEILNDSNIITLDIPEVIENAEVLSCDLTSDRQLSVEPNWYASLNFSVINNNWHSQVYSSGISLVHKSKNGKQSGMSYTIYDKCEEMKLDKGKFLSKVSDPALMQSKFKNLVRNELKLNSMSLIRKMLKIPDNNLLSVLNCVNNPLNSIERLIFDTNRVDSHRLKYERIDKVKFQRGKLALNHFKNELFCIHCDNNILMIEDVLKKLLSSKTNIKSALIPYKAIIDNLQTA